MNKQTHRTCIRMSAGEYQLLMERSKEAGLSANAWLMRQLTENRPIVYREDALPSFLRLVNRRGREINAVAWDFNGGCGTTDGLRQVLRCLTELYQATYEIRKEGLTHGAINTKRYVPEGKCGTTVKASLSA